MIHRYHASKAEKLVEVTKHLRSLALQSQVAGRSSETLADAVVNCCVIRSQRAQWTQQSALMEFRARIPSRRIFTFLCLVFCFCVSPASCVVDDKCSACKAVALELEDSLANERPRNHLDYRHRFDSQGQREGKVIDYRVSELRVVDLLDGLCAKMKPYVPNKAGPGREFWLKVEGGVPDSPEMAFNR